MVEYKDKIKYLMYKIGLRKMIPAAKITHVKIQECGEALVNIRNESYLKFGGKLVSEKTVLIRKSVAERLKEVAKLLPPGLEIKIYSAYRDIDSQKRLWRERLEVNRQKFPKLNEKALEKMTKGQVANPTKGFGGHQTGGAIDITLCDSSGRELDMGNKISEHNAKTKSQNDNLTLQQKNNRQLLLNVMEKCGFKNYPGEWWHFSYGDRMWAAYSNQKQALYGLVQPQKERK